MESKLVDAYGRPVAVELLRQPQADAEFVGIRNIYSTMHPAIGLTPEKLAMVLRYAEFGDPWLYLELCEDMEERDLHYLSVLSTRKQTVAQLELLVQPASGDAEDLRAADFVRDVLLRDGRLNLQSSLVDVLDAIGKGFSCTEIEWDAGTTTAGRVEWYPVALRHRDPRWFMFDWVSGRQVLVRTWRSEQQLRDAAQMLEAPAAGRGPLGIQSASEPLAPFKFITHFASAKSGLPIRGGLARAIAWLYLMKIYCLKDAATFAERYGMPARLGFYAAGATNEDKTDLLRAVQALGSDAAAVIPDSMRVELLTAKGGSGKSGVDIYRDLLRYIDSAISKAVLGQDFTTELPASGGSRAAAQVGKDVRDDILQWDATRLGETITRDLVRPLVDLNFGPRRRYPSVEFKILASVDARAFIDAAATAADHGVDIGQQTVREALGIPAPSPGEKLLTPKQTFSARGEEMPADPVSTPAAAPSRPAPVLHAAVAAEPAEPSTDLRRVGRAVIVEAGRVWLHAPTDEPYVMLPGGGAEVGETMADAAVREVREETGLEVELVRWLADFVDDYGHRRYYLARRTGGEPATVDADGNRPTRTLAVPLAEAAAKLTSPFDRAALAMLPAPQAGAVGALEALAARGVVCQSHAYAVNAGRVQRRPSAPLEGYAQEMAEHAHRLVEPLVDPVLRHIAEAHDFEDARRLINAAAADMGLEELREFTARACFAARAAARSKTELPE